LPKSYEEERTYSPSKRRRSPYAEEGEVFLKMKSDRRKKSHGSGGRFSIHQN